MVSAIAATSSSSAMPTKPQIPHMSACSAVRGGAADAARAGGGSADGQAAQDSRGLMAARRVQVTLHALPPNLAVEPVDLEKHPHTGAVVGRRRGVLRTRNARFIKYRRDGVGKRLSVP